MKAMPVTSLPCLYVWELIISAMVATWNIWQGMSSYLSSSSTSEGQIRMDLLYHDLTVHQGFSPVKKAFE